MNHYEMVCILESKSAEDDLKVVEGVVGAEIVKVGGELTRVESMGRRRLAYPIQGNTEGLYVLAHFSSPPGSIASLNNNLKLNPAFIRALIVRVKAPAPIVLDKALAPPADFGAGKRY